MTELLRVFRQMALLRVINYQHNYVFHIFLNFYEKHTLIVVRDQTTVKYRRGQYKRTFCPALSAQCFIQTPKHWRGNEDCWSRDCRCRMRPKGPKIEAEDRRREWGGALREGAASPLTAARGSGEHCELPQRGYCAFGDVV